MREFSVNGVRHPVNIRMPDVHKREMNVQLPMTIHNLHVLLHVSATAQIPFVHAFWSAAHVCGATAHHAQLATW